MEAIDIVLLDPLTGVQFQFPVNPSAIEIGGEASVETVEIARLGEVDWPWGNKRTPIGWEGFFPGHYDPQYCRYVSIPDPVDAKDRLVDWRTQKKVLRLIITGEHAGRRRDVINAPVIMPVFTWTLKGGEPNDIYYKVQIRQYIEVKIRTAAEAGAATGTGQPRMDLQPVPGTYVVRSGDTLWLIAQSQLGAGERWPEIYSLNRDTIGPDANAISVGMSLKLPGAGAVPTTVPPVIPQTEPPRYVVKAGRLTEN